MVSMQTFAASLLVGQSLATEAGVCGAVGSQCDAESTRSNSMLQKGRLLDRLSVAGEQGGLVEDLNVDEGGAAMEDALLSALEAAESEELRQMKEAFDAERLATWEKGMQERRRLLEHLRDVEANISLAQAEESVDCGGHSAESCAACPGEHEDKWSHCKGECKWHGAASGDCVKWPFDPKMMTVGRVLILVEGGIIYRQNSDGSDFRKFIDSNTPCPSMAHTETQRGVDHFSSRPTGIAIDEDEKRIFWTDWFGGTRVQEVDPATDELGRSEVRWSFEASVLSAPFDGSSVTPIATSGEVLQPKNLKPIIWEPAVKLKWPHYIALDKAKKKVYWTDKLDFKIQRCNYDGSGCELDFHSTEQCPGGIAVDSEGEKIYYSEDTKIYYMSTAGGKATALISSVGMVGGLDFDPAQNFVYWTSWGTTRNPGGVLRAKGYRPDVTRREYCGINSRGRRYMKDASKSCENVVYITNGKYGMGEGSYRRGPIASPFDVKGDFENGVLFWSGDEIPGIFEGLGGRVYRTSLCAALPEQSWEKPSYKTDHKPRGDFTEVAEVKGDAMFPPYVRGVALYPQRFDYEGSIPTAGCKGTDNGFVAETPSSTTCHDDYEWRDHDGKTCMDYAKDVTLCSAANGANEACCACGADRAHLGTQPTTSTTSTTTTPAPTPAASSEGECILESSWSVGSHDAVQDRVEIFVDCLHSQCKDQDGSGLFGMPCSAFGLSPGNPFCRIELMYGITTGQACPRSCGSCQ